MTTVEAAGIIQRVVSAIAYQPLVPLPPTHETSAEEIALALASADDLEDGMVSAVASLRSLAGSRRVEWWVAEDADSELQLRAADGSGDGPSATVPLGSGGVLMFVGGASLPAQAAAARLAPLVRRRVAEERLAREAGRLARRVEALEDYAALVAHELKGPLHAALAAPASGGIEQALDLVGSLLESARIDPGSGRADPSRCLGDALANHGAFRGEVEAELPPELPLAPAALGVLFRNLIGNAIAAGARSIRVTGSRSAGAWTLVIDDDGVGLSSAEGRYATGSGVGLQLCRRLAERLGGVLELCPRLGGGTRAVVAVGGRSS
jgi:signal transduction histidine kinase